MKKNVKSPSGAAMKKMKSQSGKVKSKKQTIKSVKELSYQVPFPDQAQYQSQHMMQNHLNFPSVIDLKQSQKLQPYANLPYPTNVMSFSASDNSTQLTKGPIGWQSMDQINNPNQIVQSQTTDSLLRQNMQGVQNQQVCNSMSFGVYPNYNLNESQIKQLLNDSQIPTHSNQSQSSQMYRTYDQRTKQPIQIISNSFRVSQDQTLSASRPKSRNNGTQSIDQSENAQMNVSNFDQKEDYPVTVRSSCYAKNSNKDSQCMMSIDSNTKHNNVQFRARSNNSDLSNQCFSINIPSAQYKNRGSKNGDTSFSQSRAPNAYVIKMNPDHGISTTSTFFKDQSNFSNTKTSLQQKQKMAKKNKRFVSPLNEKSLSQGRNKKVNKNLLNKQKSYINVNIENLQKLNQNKIYEKQLEMKSAKTISRKLETEKSKSRKRMIVQSQQRKKSVSKRRLKTKSRSVSRKRKFERAYTPERSHPLIQPSMRVGSSMFNIHKNNGLQASRNPKSNIYNDQPSFMSSHNCLPSSYNQSSNAMFQSRKQSLNRKCSTGLTQSKNKIKHRDFIPMAQFIDNKSSQSSLGLCNYQRNEERCGRNNIGMSNQYMNSQSQAQINRQQKIGFYEHTIGSQGNTSRQSENDDIQYLVNTPGNDFRSGDVLNDFRSGDVLQQSDQQFNQFPSGISSRRKSDFVTYTLGSVKKKRQSSSKKRKSGKSTVRGKKSATPKSFKSSISRKTSKSKGKMSQRKRKSLKSKSRDQGNLNFQRLSLYQNGVGSPSVSDYQLSLLANDEKSNRPKEVWFRENRMTSPSEMATKTDMDKSSDSSSSYLGSHHSHYVRQTVKNTIRVTDHSSIKINKHVKPIEKQHSKEESLNMKSRQIDRLEKLKEEMKKNLIGVKETQEKLKPEKNNDTLKDQVEHFAYKIRNMQIDKEEKLLEKQKDQELKNKIKSIQLERALKQQSLRESKVMFNPSQSLPSFNPQAFYYSKNQNQQKSASKISYAIQSPKSPKKSSRRSSHRSARKSSRKVSRKKLQKSNSHISVLSARSIGSNLPSKRIIKAEDSKKRRKYKPKSSIKSLRSSISFVKSGKGSKKRMKENIEHLNKYIRDHSRNSNKKVRTSVSKLKKVKSAKKLKSKSKSKSRKMNNINSSFLGSIKSSNKARGSVYSSCKNSGRKSVNSARSQSARKSKRQEQPQNYYQTYDRRIEPLLSSDFKQRSILKNQNSCFSQRSQSNQDTPKQKHWESSSSRSSDDSDTDNDFQLMKEASNMDSVDIMNGKRRSQLPKWQILAMKQIRV